MDTNQESLREIRCSRALFTCQPCRTFTWVLYIQHPNLFNLHSEQAGSLACSPSVYEAAHFSLSETPSTNTSLGLLSSSIQTRCPGGGSWSGHVCLSSLVSAQPSHSTSQPHQISSPSSPYQALVSKPLHVPSSHPERSYAPNLGSHNSDLASGLLFDPLVGGAFSDSPPLHLD